MNKALLSSKKMDWCTPKDFFDELDKEFNFILDAAATKKNTKCKKYFTPEIDGLKQSWNVGGRFSVTHHTDERSGNGWKKHTRKPKKEQRLFF